MTTNLWEKQNTVTPDWLKEFTAGNDKVFDLELAEFDVLGSLAHAAMLAKTGLITNKENDELKNELSSILSEKSGP